MFFLCQSRTINTFILEVESGASPFFSFFIAHFLTHFRSQPVNCLLTLLINNTPVFISVHVCPLRDSALYRVAFCQRYVYPDFNRPSFVTVLIKELFVDSGSKVIHFCKIFKYVFPTQWRLQQSKYLISYVCTHTGTHAHNSF